MAVSWLLFNRSCNLFLEVLTDSCLLEYHEIFTIAFLHYFHAPNIETLGNILGLVWAKKFKYIKYFIVVLIIFYFSGLNEFLQSLGQEYSIYTYEMLNKGIDRDTLLSINDEQLLLECGIDNKIHRLETIL